MPTDSLNRRLRWGERTPRKARMAITPADLAIFAAIDRHGPLPSHYIHAFAKHLRPDKSQTLNRLTEFYHGTHSQRPLLDRPPQQFAQWNAHARHTVYDLTAAGRHLLAEQGLLSRYTPRRFDPFVHRLMNACVGASIELTCPAVGLTYVGREVIIEEKASEEARTSPNPLAITVSGTQLVPDDLFALQFPDGWRRYCAVEVDRNTESIDRRVNSYNTVAKKVGAYVTVLETSAYRTWWDVPNLGILIVTTNSTHAINILDHIANYAKPWANRFAIQVAQDFGHGWRVPAEVQSQLLLQAWTGLSGLKTISQL